MPDTRKNMHSIRLDRRGGAKSLVATNLTIASEHKYKTG